MLKTFAHASLSTGFLLLAAASARPQEVVMDPLTAGVVGAQGQGFLAYGGVPFPPFEGFTWYCGFDGAGELIPAGQVAENVHLIQAGDLASITFTFKVRSASLGGSGPLSGTASAILSVYHNDPGNTLLPSPATLIDQWTIPVTWQDNVYQVVSFDVPVPFPVSEDLWIGVEIDSPAGSAGSLAGKGAGQGIPTIVLGGSANLTWFGASDCEPAGGRLQDNGDVGFIGHYGVDVRIFPGLDCPDAVANGDFESGDLAPWSADGRAGVATSARTLVFPPSGGYEAVVTSGDLQSDVNGGAPILGLSGSPVDAGSLESSLGLVPGTLDALTPGSSPSEGSAIQLELDVNAGDTLRFRWNFLTNEQAADPFVQDDLAFVSIGSGAILLASVYDTSLIDSSSIHFRETGWQTYEHEFASPGTFMIGFGVVDQGNAMLPGDTDVHSTLLVDCVELVPADGGGNQPPSCTVDLTQARADFLEVAPGAFVVTEGETFTVPFGATDPDGDVLQVTATALPPGASLAPISGAAPLTSTLVWTPTAGDKSGAPWVVGVTFTDPSDASATCEVTVADINLKPICSTQDVTVECTGPDGALVTLTGSAADADDPPENLVFTWFVSDASVVLDDLSSPTPTGLFPIGVTTATLCVTDGRGGLAVCDATVTVQDTIPPEVQCTTDVAALWPPKHAMRSVTLVVTSTDACTNPSMILPITVQVSSSEPDDASGGGDGHTSGDVHGQDGYTAPVDVTSSFTYDALAGQWVGTVLLRAERQGSGNGRKYTIDVSAVDSAGNPATTSCCVIVPHDQRKSSAP